MNVKEFKKRWLRGYVRPELFYLPVEDNYDFKPMIIKVEVSGANNKCYINIYPTINKSPRCQYYYVENNVENDDSAGTYVTYIHSDFNTSVLPNFCLYNMKTPDNIPVNKTNFPDFFKNFLEEDILFESAMPFLNINWGDGTTSEFSEEEICKSYTMNIDGIECTGYYFSFSITTVPIREKLTHIYESDGIYEVIISGNLPHISFHMLSPAYSNNHCVLTEVVQWGNLHLRSTNNLASIGNLSTGRGHIKIPPLDNSFNKVLTATSMFQYLDITFNDLGGDDCMKFFPNLINANNMFYGAKITYIPEYFTINNKKLINISAMFYSCVISHIGDYAFANLPELRDISSIFAFYNFLYVDFDLKTCIVGNSIFENDVNLTSVDFLFQNNVSYNDNRKLVLIKSVGNNIFKGCKNIVTAFDCFYENVLLESIGEGLFEGCENLYRTSYLFAYSPLLRNIGANLFKGCKNLREVNGMFSNSCQVQMPDNLFYDLEFNSDFKDNSMDMGYFTDGWNTFNKTTDADGNVTEYYNSDAGISKLSSIASEKYNEFISKGYDGFPSIKMSKNMFNSNFLNDLILHNCCLNNIGGYTCFAGSIVAYNETVFQHCFYTHQGTGQTISADFPTKSVYRKRTASEGEVPDFWNYDEKLIPSWKDTSNNDFLALFGYTNQHGQNIENYTYSIKNSNNSYTTYQTGYSRTEIYDINKGKWDNVNSIPNPKIYTLGANNYNNWVRQDCRYLTYSAPTYCPIGYMNSDIEFIRVDE